MPNDVFGLYLVITDPVTSYEACAEAAVAEKVRYIQLRMKQTAQDTVIRVARRLRAITRGANTLLIVNDDPVAAVEAEADGAHLGQDDMSLFEARERFPSLRVFGLSTHNEDQARTPEAQAADYCGVGPIFPTPTKAIPDPTLGVERAGAIMRAAPCTTVAIGGINAANLRDVLRAGALNFAVVREVCRSPRPAEAIRRLQQIWQDAQS